MSPSLLAKADSADRQLTYIFVLSPKLMKSVGRRERRLSPKSVQLYEYGNSVALKNKAQ